MACMHSPFLSVCHPAEVDHSNEHLVRIFIVALLLLLWRNRKYFVSTLIPVCRKFFFYLFFPRWPKITSRKFKSAKPHRHFSIRSLRPTSRDLPDHKSVYCQFPKAKHWLEFIRITSRYKKTQWAVLVQVNIWCLLGLWGLTEWLEFSTFWTKLLSSQNSSDWLWFLCLRERTCHYSVRLLWKTSI